MFRSTVISGVVFMVMMLAAIGIGASFKAGRCPYCDLPTFYEIGHKSHSCLRCGRIFRLTEDGERTPKL